MIMVDPSRISYVPLDNFSDEETQRFIQHMQKDFSPLGGQLDAVSLWNFFITDKPGRWVTFYEERPIGLCGLASLPEVPGFYQTSTYLFSDFRGHGYNRHIKRITLQAFSAFGGNVKLGAVVKEWNIRSQKAMRNAFPQAKRSVLIFSAEDALKYDGLFQYFYDFTPHLEDEWETYSCSPVYRTVTEWLSARFRNS